ncbi:epimerase [Marinomonas piezotolerans]|uniref:Epimerase n=1 Tax=Marinomonas piezotolerans TaxID=2213058 RepID=A0A370UAS1_9GAMM|nr:NAD-dependent epimerase/dehydratase family protein [Marinomonas piezotolerans]RDL44864.1 epimerase [Marinomonas piezotolerans]
MVNVLVAGCGDLGRLVASHFVAQGAQVTGMRRQSTEFPMGVTGITGDLTQLGEGAWPDVDLLYLIMTPLGRTADAYQKAYVDAANAVVSAYQHRPNKPNVVFVSSTSVYGQSQGQLITDESVALPATATAEKLLEAETILANALPTTAVRCSGIYGPGRYRLLDGVRQAEPWKANSWTNRIHRDDVVSGLCLLGDLALAGETLPRAVLASDEQPVSMWEVKLWLSHQLNVAPPLPDQIAFSDYFPTSGKRIVASKLKQMGWRPQYPSYVSGYESMLDHYLAHRNA